MIVTHKKETITDAIDALFLRSQGMRADRIGASRSAVLCNLGGIYWGHKCECRSIFGF